MYKIVNIYPKFPIIGVNPPIRTVVRKVTKSIADIRTCIIARAIVEEVLPDGSIVILDLNNFDKDNSNTVVEEPVTESEKPATVKEAVSEPVKDKTSDTSDNNRYDNKYTSKYSKRNKRNKYNNRYTVEETHTVEEENTSDESNNEEELVDTVDVEDLM